MARKKSISISRKPSSEPAPMTELVFSEPSATSLLSVEAASSSALTPTASLGFVGRFIYGTVYGVTYGVVFSTLFLGKLIPGSELVGKAMQDGTESAKRDFNSPTKNDPVPNANELAA